MNMEATIKIEPFSEFAACPKCGEADEGIHMPQFQPPCPQGDFTSACIPLSPPSLPPVRMVGYSKINTRYCRGGLEPEAKEQDASLAMVNAMASMINSKAPQLGQPKLNICAGVYTEHLHKICIRCQYEYLTETKDGKKD